MEGCGCARLKAGEIAPPEAAAMSYHQLYWGLKEELSITPTRFIRGVRVEIAAAMLLDGSGGVTHVAYAVGFDSLSYFRRAFRERYGTEPVTGSFLPDSFPRGARLFAALNDDGDGLIDARVLKNELQHAGLRTTDTRLALV